MNKIHSLSRHFRGGFEELNSDRDRDRIKYAFV